MASENKKLVMDAWNSYLNGSITTGQLTERFQGIGSIKLNKYNDRGGRPQYTVEIGDERYSLPISDKSKKAIGRVYDAYEAIAKLAFLLYKSHGFSHSIS